MKDNGFLAAILMTFSFLPQAILTLRTCKTDEISLTMYLMLNLGIMCWLVYGQICWTTTLTYPPSNTSEPVL